MKKQMSKNNNKDEKEEYQSEDNKHWLFYISKEVYEESQKIIRDTFMKLMSEMKQTVHKIEMR